MSGFTRYLHREMRKKLALKEQELKPAALANLLHPDKKPELEALMAKHPGQLAWIERLLKEGEDLEDIDWFLGVSESVGGNPETLFKLLSRLGTTVHEARLRGWQGR